MDLTTTTTTTTHGSEQPSISMGDRSSKSERMLIVSPNWEAGTSTWVDLYSSELASC